MKEIISLAKEKQIPKLHAEIDSFHAQSRKMFQSLGFVEADKEQYILMV